MNVKQMGDKIGVDWSKIDIEQLKQGIKIEQEHGDTVKNDPETIAKIAIDHLKEFPDYYTRLSKIENNEFYAMMDKFYEFACEYLELDDNCEIELKNDIAEASKLFGKTAAYSPDSSTITLFIGGRHPKDVLRSLGHELVHFKQHLDGRLQTAMMGEQGPDYAQKNPKLRKLEQEANEKGSMMLRDFEDLEKYGSKLHERKNRLLLMERLGYRL